MSTWSVLWAQLGFWRPSHTPTQLRLARSLARTTRTRNETETDFPIGGLLRRLIPLNLRHTYKNSLWLIRRFRRGSGLRTSHLLSTIFCFPDSDLVSSISYDSSCVYLRSSIFSILFIFYLQPSTFYLLSPVFYFLSSILYHL